MTTPTCIDEDASTMTLEKIPKEENLIDKGPLMTKAFTICEGVGNPFDFTTYGGRKSDWKGLSIISLHAA